MLVLSRTRVRSSQATDFRRPRARGGAERGRSPTSPGSRARPAVSPPRSAADLVVRARRRSRQSSTTRGPRCLPRARRRPAAEVQVFGLVGRRTGERPVRRASGARERREITELPPAGRRSGARSGRDDPLRRGAVGGPRRREPRPPLRGDLLLPAAARSPPEAGTRLAEARARRGSEVVFRTTLACYVAASSAAEHAGLTGEAAVAPGARSSRTTPGRAASRPAALRHHHCQVFLGTARPTAGSRAPSASRSSRRAAGFRTSAVATSPGRSAALRSEVRAVLGDAQGLRGDGRTVEVTRPPGVERVPASGSAPRSVSPAAPRRRCSRRRRCGYRDGGEGTGSGSTSRRPAARG
jgi:hypothetical protein